MALAFELAKAPEETYQIVEVSDQKLHVKDTRQPGIGRRFFWWIRGGWGRPRRLHGLKPLQVDFTELWGLHVTMTKSASILVCTDTAAC